MTEQLTQPARKTVSDHLKAFGGALLIVAFTLLLLEILLATLDPWGMRYFNDMAQLGNNIFQRDPVRGYVMADGSYTFSNWNATVVDSLRVVPDTAPDAACKLVMLGDSVAFGYGVDDAETWVNLLAQQFDDLTIINTGVARYSIPNILGAHAAYDGNAWLYMVVNNDIDPAIDPEAHRFVGDGSDIPWLVRYMNFAIYRGGGTDYVPPADPEALLPETAGVQRFFADLDTLMQDERVYLASFEREAITNTIIDRGYPVFVLPPYPQMRNSVADYHLNPEGNRLLADWMLPLIETIRAERCGDT